MTLAGALTSRRRLSSRSLLAIALGAALFLVSLGLAVMNERAVQAEAVRQANVQARILAGSVAAPLAFDDSDSAQGYLDALRANPAVEAAGAYDAAGRPVARFLSSGRAAPDHSAVGPPAIAGGRVVVTAPAVQGTTAMGSVYLRVRTEGLSGRALRYFPIGAVVLMSSLLVAMLGASNAAIRDAHRRLREEVAEREKAQEALRQAQKMEAMGQLTGGVAHDFNNLLMVASSGLDLMDRSADPVRRERIKQGIRQAIDRGANLTQQLLSFSRKAPLKSEVVDLTAGLAGLRTVLDRTLREDITVSIEADPGLWPVELDPTQFEVALINIAVNARDAMANGGMIRITARNVEASLDGRDAVLVSVTDTGEGIAPETLPRVFEPFFTTKAVGKGTGLGLSQVYGFARASGGEVRAESQVGEGTTVTLVLPRSDKAAAAAPAVRPAEPRDAHGRRHVLLVEDDDRVAEWVGEMLVELGYDYVRAATASGALDQLGSGQAFDIVFSDMVMPGEMSGLELARAIARSRPNLPVLLTTGYSTSAEAATAEGLPLLLKPYRIEALAQELQTALQGGPSVRR